MCVWCKRELHGQSCADRNAFVKPRGKAMAEQPPRAGSIHQADSGEGRCEKTD